MTSQLGLGTVAASRRRRLIVASALVVGAGYLLVRLTTLGSGWLLSISIPLYLAELGAFVQFSLLAFASWQVPVRTRLESRRKAKRPVDILIDATNAEPTMLERTLVGAATVETSGRICVIDSAERPDVRRVADSFEAAYIIDEGLVHSTAKVLHRHATSDLYVWLEAGQVPMPNLISASRERFDDARVAVCQTAIGLLNSDSLVHVQRGRDEGALQRDVLGPGLDRMGVAPWSGPGSLVRTLAIASVGGFPERDEAAVARTLVLLHADGWASAYQSQTLVRAVAPDTLDEYLEQRRQHVIQTLRVFRTAQNPLRAPSLTLRQRLSHLTSAAAFGSGVHHLVVAAVLVTALLTGQVPIAGPLGSIAAMWGASFSLGLLARRNLARGTMRVGDWTRQAWRTAGADVTGLRAVFGLRAQQRLASQQPAATGLRTLGRLRALTVSVIIVDVALLVRAATLIEPSLLPAFSTTEKVLVLAFGIAVLVPMVDVLQLVVTRRQRRRNFRLAVALDIDLGENSARTIDLATGGVGVRMRVAPGVGSVSPIRLELPSANGTGRAIRGTAVVRSVNPEPNDMYRVGLEFENLNDEARIALVEYCMIGHSVNDSREAAVVADPHALEIERDDHEHRSLRALTGTAALATVAMLLVGPVAASASEGEAIKAERVCVIDAESNPVPGAAVEQLSGTTWSAVATTDKTGCVKVDPSTPLHGFAATSGNVRTENASAPDEKGTVYFTQGRFEVRLLSSQGTGVSGARVRYFADRWHDAGTTDAAGVAQVDSLSDAIEVEFTWRGRRIVLPLGEAGAELALGRIDAGGLDIAEINRGDGWEPFHDAIQVMPGRIAVRLTNGSVIKTTVTAGHARDLATLTETPIPAAPPTKGEG